MYVNGIKLPSAFPTLKYHSASTLNLNPDDIICQRLFRLLETSGTLPDDVIQIDDIS